MKRKILLLALSSAFIVDVSAQLQAQIQVGIFAGPQFSRRNFSKELGTGNGILKSINSGATIFFPVAKDFFIHGSLGYSGKGVIVKDLTFTDNLGNSLGTGNVKMLVHYIELRLPFNDRLSLSPNTSFLAGLGPYFSYAVGGYEKISEGNAYANQKTKIEFGKDGHKRFDFGITAELGLQLNNKFLLGVSADFGVVEVINIQGGTNRNNSLSITLGYLFYRQFKHDTKKF